MTPIERKAREIVRGNWTTKYCNECIPDDEWRKLEDLIAAALRTQVEECAKVADAMNYQHKPLLTSGELWMKEAIAAAIRGLGK